MSTSSLREFWRIKIYVPVIQEPRETSLRRIAPLALENVRPILSAALSIIPVGRVGNYDAIYEIDFGFEGYRPAAGASPEYGAIGQSVELGKAAFITYVDRTCGKEVLQRLAAAVRAVHPWEHPIIEFTECLLFVPDARI